jgi:hypothetical protein
MPDVPHVDEQVDDEDAPCDDVDRDEHSRVGRLREATRIGGMLSTSGASALEAANYSSRLPSEHAQPPRPGSLRGSGTTRHEASSCDASTCGGCWVSPAAVRAGEDLEQMAVGIGEVDAPSAVVD